MDNDRHLSDQTYWSEVRLLLEELCCDFCRFEHAVRKRLPMNSVRIDREFFLGTKDAFADIRVEPRGKPSYFVEVKYGYGDDSLVRSLSRKYKRATPRTRKANQVILVIDVAGRPGWKNTVKSLRKCLHSGLELVIWDEKRLHRLFQKCFDLEIALEPDTLLDVRYAVDRAKGFLAFGGPSQDDYEHTPLKAELMWHLGFWRIRELREAGDLPARAILPPGIYRNVVVLLADLCSFSSFVRDTPNTEVVRENLTAFYSKSRYQLINNGAMMYQFVGDQVVGFFGIPNNYVGVADDALETAYRLVGIGRSVTNHWQRRIDRVQNSGGLHVGMAVGDIEIVSLRPFSRTHMGAIGDCINVAARLMAQAGPGDIVATNSLYQTLTNPAQAPFVEIAPIEAKNVGKIKGWKVPAE